MGFIINDGRPSRGHRNNIFKPTYQVVGVGCGDHTSYQNVRVINYVSDFLNRSVKRWLKPLSLLAERSIS